METGVCRYSSVSACDGPNIALRFLGNDAADPPISCDADDAHEDCWQQLEAFWGAEKHRCAHESPAFESSTESQLESRDFLSEPPKLPEEQPARKATKPSPASPANDFLYIVRGEDVNDVPTSYVVNGIKPHEFPVIGTYVDKRVVPGFRYVVRVNRTTRFLFGGRALRLDSVGRGYGKRITFEAPPGGLNENDNYFYSDTIAQGYGFAPIAVQVGDRFRVEDSQGDVCGDLLLDELIGEQSELSGGVAEDGAVVKEIAVDFYARFLCVNNKLLDRQLVWNRVRLSAVASLVKPRRAAEARLEKLRLQDCPLAGYELVPFSRKAAEE